MEKLDKPARRWLIVLIVFLVVFLVTDLICQFGRFPAFVSRTMQNKHFPSRTPGPGDGFRGATDEK